MLELLYYFNTQGGLSDDHMRCCGYNALVVSTATYIADINVTNGTCNINFMVYKCRAEFVFMSDVIFSNYCCFALWILWSQKRCTKCLSGNEIASFTVVC